ncbi:ankyrin repeat and SAM domain-containing protein 1A-like isoform X2 [Bolinopsis microptera]
MNRLSLSGERKSRNSPRSSSPALPASPSGSEIIIPETDQNVRNPLYTPSPSGTPCGSPAVSSYLTERLQEEDIYDSPASFKDRPPVLPPKKKKSLSLKLRHSVNLERSGSDSSLTNTRSRFSSQGIASPSRHPSESIASPSRHPSESIASPSRHPSESIASPSRHPSESIASPSRHDSSQSFGSRNSSQAAGSRNSSTNADSRHSSQNMVIGTTGEEFVGSLIEKSKKSNKLEKRLSRKGKKKVQEVEEVAKKRKEEEEEAAGQRSSTLSIKDDWDEIDTMMMALQCDIDLTQQTIRRPAKLKYNSTRDKSLEEWLVKLELPEIQTMLELNGWDHIDFIRQVISKEDLAAMGINNDKVKRKLFKSVEEDLENFQHGSVPETVEEWLTSIHLSKYLNKFISCRMGSVSRVLEIWEVELTSILTIEPIGHRKRIMRSIRDLRTLQSSFDEAEKRKKDRKPKTAAEEKWLHSKEEMLRGVDYPVRYFGSAIVTGPESTKQSGLICEQQQSKIKSNQKVPEFRLRISASGVELIDKQTHTSTCSYHIEDISFVSRDKSNLLVFSFISSDRKLSIKMCHVFKAHTRNQAYEACSTIAQSFEVAFQLKHEGNGVHYEEKS